LISENLSFSWSSTDGGLPPYAFFLCFFVLQWLKAVFSFLIIVYKLDRLSTHFSITLDDVVRLLLLRGWASQVFWLLHQAVASCVALPFLFLAPRFALYARSSRFPRLRYFTVLYCIGSRLNKKSNTSRPTLKKVSWLFRLGSSCFSYFQWYHKDLDFLNSLDSAAGKLLPQLLLDTRTFGWPNFFSFFVFFPTRFPGTFLVPFVRVSLKWNGWMIPLFLLRLPMDPGCFFTEFLRFPARTTPLPFPRTAWKNEVINFYLCFTKFLIIEVVLCLRSKVLVAILPPPT